MKNIIVLDIDGVLCCDRVHIANSAYDCPDNRLRKFDPVAVRFLTDLGRKYNIEFVISSTWRNVLTESILKMAFNMSGLDITLHKYWQTPVGKHRYDEIESWLFDIDTKEYDNIIVIDDIPLDKFDFDNVHNIKTSFMDGMNYDNFADIINILEGYEID